MRAMAESEKRPISGRLLIVAAAVLWSFSGIAVRNLRGLDPLAITGFRSLFTLPVLVVALAGSAGWEATFRALRESLRRPVTWIAAACYMLMLTLFISATAYTTTANAILLQYTAPMYIALFSVPLLGEPIRFREWATIAGCVFGMGFFFWEKLSGTGLLGNILGALSGVACGMNAIFLRMAARPRAAGSRAAHSRAARSRGAHSRAAHSRGARSRAARSGTGPADPEGQGRSQPGLEASLPYLILGNAMTMMVCLPWCVGALPEMSPFKFGVLAAMGVLQLGIPYVLFAVGMRTVPAFEGMVIGLLEAVLNPLWTAVGVGEIPSPSALVGGLIILGSVVGYSWVKKTGTRS